MTKEKHQAVTKIKKGLKVTLLSEEYIVTHIVDIDKFIAKNILSGAVQQFSVADIQIAETKEATAQPPDLNEVNEQEWKIAENRYAIIKPLLETPRRTRQLVQQRAEESGVNASTLYRWITVYETSGLMTSLIPQMRTDRGSRKLEPEVEAIIQGTIESDFLNSQRKSIAKVSLEIRKRCITAKLPPPSVNTIRNRIQSLPAAKMTAARHGRQSADNKYRPLEGSFPGADWPLAVVQIDHTKLDVILVDDQYRRPVGRPWITLAIDVYSRMVTGFYVSFDPPGALSTGLCLAHSILPKESWLAKHNIEEAWPCWGLPTKIHFDNAKEFRGNMLQRACTEYGITIEWRPVARPHFGGHIERLLGTFAREIHALPGTTFSSTAQRAGYDSDAKAALTLSEFETWFVTLVAKVYHKRLHSALGTSPIEKYRKGIMGDGTKLGIGILPKIKDEERLRLDLMPFEERTIQPYGVVIDEIHYYHDVLRRWINATDPKSPKNKRKFTFRQDPRDISQIWFYDPEVSTYFPIPYRDTSRPAMSIWELREARRRLEDEGRVNIDESALFEAFDRMREIEQAAIGKTKAVRRAQQRRVRSDTRPPLEPKSLPVILDDSIAGDLEIESIQPFDEMDDMQP